MRSAKLSFTDAMRDGARSWPAFVVGGLLAWPIMAAISPTPPLRWLALQALALPTCIVTRALWDSRRGGR